MGATEKLEYFAWGFSAGRHAGGANVLAGIIVEGTRFHSRSPALRPMVIAALSLASLLELLTPRLVVTMLR